MKIWKNKPVISLEGKTPTSVLITQKQSYRKEAVWSIYPVMLFIELTHGGVVTFLKAFLKSLEGSPSHSRPC
jgi:hypothetical protein